MRYFLVILVITFVACGTKTESTTVATSKTSNTPKQAVILEGATYHLVRYQQQPVSVEVSLTWDTHQRFSAKFCNQINAQDVPYLKSPVVSSRAMMTKMACLDNTLMQMEDAFASGLSAGMQLQVNHGKNDAQTLIFTTKKGEVFAFESVARFME